MKENRRNLAIAVFMFAVIIINPRDFPISNVPLIYPAFLLFWYKVGNREVALGLYRVKYLISVLVFIQIYILMLRYLNNVEIELVGIAYIIEPAIILLVSSAVAAFRDDGVKNIIYIVILITVFSSLIGVFVIFGSEIFRDFRDVLHHSIGGNIIEGAKLRIEDGQSSIVELRNTGLGLDVVMFGYLLTFSSAMVLSLIYDSGKGSKLHLYFILIILLIGIVTNAQRSILAALVFASLVHFIAFKKTLSILKIIVFIVALLGLLFILFRYSNVVLLNSIFNRDIIDEGFLTRFYMIIPTLLSVLEYPLGYYSLTPSYIEEALRLGWTIEKNGSIVALGPHNHFIAIIMFSGVYGILAIIYLFSRFKSFLKRIVNYGGVYERTVFTACIALIVHSSFHNYGFFGLTPPVLIAFGALWGRCNVKICKSNLDLMHRK